MLRILLVGLLLVSCDGLHKNSNSNDPAQPTLESVVGWNFDWDDNIMYMPTSIVLFEKETQAELEMGTGEFAVHRKTVGKSGEYKGKQLVNYQVRTDDDYNSFRYFRDGKNGENYFLRDLKKAFLGKESQWKGPSWDAFLFALNEKESADLTTIITARGHSASAVLVGLKHLKKLGYIKFLIPEENIFAVSNPVVTERFAVEGGAASPSAIKAEVMKTVLDNLQSKPLDNNTEFTTNRDGDGVRAQHLWGFSDDDRENYIAARDVLAAEVAKGRWPDVKIVVFYTGVHDKRHPQEIRVLKSNGKARKRLAAELNEGFTSN